MINGKISIPFCNPPVMKSLIEESFEFKENPTFPFLIKKINRHSFIIEYNETIILSSLTFNVAKPSDDRPLEGLVSFFVDSLSPKDFLNQFTSNLSRVVPFLDKSFKKSKSFDLESLLISPSTSCICVRIDLHVLQDAGNVLMATSLSVLYLLHNVFLPQYELLENDQIILHNIDKKHLKPINIFFKTSAIELSYFPDICSLYVSFSDRGDQICVHQESILEVDFEYLVSSLNFIKNNSLLQISNILNNSNIIAI